MGAAPPQRAAVGRAVPPRVDLHASTGASCSPTSATSRSPTARRGGRRRATAHPARLPRSTSARWPCCPMPRPRIASCSRTRRHRFWLDSSSAVIEGLSRFSFMGDGVGPARRVRDLRRRRAAPSTVERGGTRDLRRAAVLRLPRRAAARAAPCRRRTGCRSTSTSATSAASATSSRRETAATRPIAPTTPDAALLFADRMLAHRPSRGHVLPARAQPRRRRRRRARLARARRAGALLGAAGPRGDASGASGAAPPLVGMTDPARAAARCARATTGRVPGPHRRVHRARSTTASPTRSA